MKRLMIMLAGMLAILTSCAGDNSREDLAFAERALDNAARQSLMMYQQVRARPGRFPRTTANDTLVTSHSRWWTSGFFPGTLWYLYEFNRDDSLRAAAEAMTERVSKEQYTTNNHDVGFQINCSFGNGYRLTGNPLYREAMLNAASSLATRFDPVVGCTRSWEKRLGWEYPVIIDNMMNLELLEVASVLGGGESYAQMARSHSDRTLKNHFRNDGSSYHVVDYDPQNGGVAFRGTRQGYSDASAWARGQAWALYGYTMMYRMTGNEAYLNQARKVAGFIADHPRLPGDKVPYWDFDAPEIPHALRDASAAAIMASGYLELSTYVKGDEGRRYFDIARQQLQTLASPEYTAGPGTNCGFILKHSVGSLPGDSEVDVPLSYADYYYVEALLRYRRLLLGEPVVAALNKP